MPDSALSALGLGYSVDGTYLVADTNISVAAGELVAVLGPNGAGKSTLLGLLAGDLRPTTGSVHYGDTLTASLAVSERALHRAVFSQTSPFDIPLTCTRVVSLGRYPHRHDQSISPEEDAAFVVSAMEATDTIHLAHRAYSSLSGGERTRVAIARVLAQNTPIVLLDEPTTALDVYHQERVLGILRETADGGKAVVAVHHDLNSAMTYADRVVVMASGRVVANGTPAEVLTADLLASVYGVPMAVLDHPLHTGKIVLVSPDRDPGSAG